MLVFESKSSKLAIAGAKIATPVPSGPARPLDDSIENNSVIAIKSDDTRHVHSLGYYPSKFIPEIPRWAIDQWSSPGDIVMDPYIGSGTTAVESVIAKRSSIASDISPWAALLTRAKTTRAQPDDIRDAAAHLVSRIQRRDFPDAAPPEFELSSFWFAEPHLNEFARIRELIETDAPKNLREFFLAVAASTIRYFSYQDQAQIKVKRDPKKVLLGTPSPSDLFVGRVGSMVDRLISFNEKAAGSLASSTSFVSSATNLSFVSPQSVDLVVTSPPYINAMNYPMASRYELLLLGLVSDGTLHAHQATYHGSERVYARDYRAVSQVDKAWNTAEYLNPRLQAIYASEPKRAHIAQQYFQGMHSALTEIHDKLRNGGRLVLVVGTNVIRSVPIDTFAVLRNMTLDMGMEDELTFHYEIVKQAFKLTRHRTANIIPHDGVAVMVKR